MENHSFFPWSILLLFSEMCVSLHNILLEVILENKKMKFITEEEERRILVIQKTALQTVSTSIRR